MALTIAVPIVLGTLGILVVVFFLLDGLRGPATSAAVRTLAARFPGETVLRLDAMANGFGVESAGPWQLRGTGTLALTEQRLWFSMLAVSRELEIPREAIREVDLCDSFLRKRVLGRKLLRVRYERGGTEDRAAWLVAEPEAWVEALRVSPKPPG